MVLVSAMLTHADFGSTLEATSLDLAEIPRRPITLRQYDAWTVTQNRPESLHLLEMSIVPKRAPTRTADVGITLYMPRAVQLWYATSLPLHYMTLPRPDLSDVHAPAEATTDSPTAHATAGQHIR